MTMLFRTAGAENWRKNRAIGCDEKSVHTFWVRFWHVFSGVYLASSMGALAVLFVPRDLPANQVNTNFVLLWCVLYALSIIQFFAYPVRVRRGDIGVVILYVLIVASTLWSGAGLHTFVYGSSAALNALFAFNIARAYSVRSFVNLLVTTIIMMVVASVVLHASGFGFTRYIDDHQRLNFLGSEPVRGLFNHKITAALYASIALGIVLVTQKGIVRILVCVGLSYFILLSGSASGIVLAVAGVAIHLSLRFLTRMRVSPGLYLLLVGVAGAIGLFLSILVLPEVLELLGRDPTFTGRTVLWQWGISAGLERPLLGWGFMGYLTTPEAQDYVRSIASFQGWEVPHFHNSYVQMFANLGIAGLILTAWCLIFAMYQHYRRGLRASSEAPYNLVLCGAIMVMAIGASFIHLFFKYNDFSTILVLFAVLAVGREKIQSAGVSKT